MNTRETLLIINALTGWGLTTLTQTLFPHLVDPPFPEEKDICLERIIKNISPRQRSIQEKLKTFEKHFDSAQEMWDCDRNGIRLITFYDREYPQDLLFIHNAPLMLYVKGDTECLSNPCLAIVGSRKATPKGRSFAFQISSQLTEYGFTIISGLALGIDGESHRGALQKQGKTVAVLGSGLLEIYPREHTSLAESIADTGALISEFPLHTKPLPFHFPRRNRIISGLSKGVLVVEAATRSGSLITANMAGEQGKDVFAVPGGPFDKCATGTNALIRDGAKLTTSIDDIVNEYSFTRQMNCEPLLPLTDSETKQGLGITPEEKSVLDHLSIDPISLEPLCTQCNADFKDLSHILLTLELKKYIKVYPGNRYGLNYRRTEHKRNMYEKESCHR